MINIEIRCSFYGIAARFVEGQRYTAKNERRQTDDDTGIVTIQRLTIC